MEIKLIHIAYGNYVAINRLIAMAVPTSSAIRRTVEEARDKGVLITLTNGRRCKTAIFLDSGHIVLSALEPETIAGRITDEEGKGE